MVAEDGEIFYSDYSTHITPILLFNVGQYRYFDECLLN